MSILKREIKEQLHQIVCHEDGRITAEISYPGNFTGFKGHFPGKPIVPGVCKVLTVLTLLELSLKRKVHLRLIVSSKFMAPTGPKEKLMIELRREVQSGTAERVKALFKSADKKIAEILIEVNYE